MPKITFGDILGFVSTILEVTFDVVVDFSEGFSTAPETVRVVPLVGNVNTAAVEKVARMAQVGPCFIRDMADKVDQYIAEKEKKVGLRNKKSVVTSNT